MNTAQWANIGEDPGTLHALLERIPGHVPVGRIDYVWIFPARRVAIGESIVIVVAAYDDDPARRRVHTAHFTTARTRKGQATVSERFDEHGAAPEAAVHRIVHGVLRRLGEDADAPPREESVAGSLDAWNDLIVELGGRPRAIAADDDDAAAASSAGDDPAAPP